MKKILIFVLVLVLVGAGYFYFLRTSPTITPVIEEEEVLPTSGRREQVTIESKGNLGIATTLGGEKYVVDRNGMTLYYNTADATQKSAPVSWSCDSRCEKNWLPYLVDEVSTPLTSSSDPLLKLLNTFKRPDGRDHYALQSKILYRYRGDKVQGDMQGENWGEGWMVARP